METTQKKIEAEVRLYYQGNLNWNTEYFQASCNTDLANKAIQIAKEKKADHFSFGRATPEDEPTINPRNKKKTLSSNVKEQVEAIETAMGLKDGTSKTWQNN